MGNARRKGKMSEMTTEKVAAGFRKRDGSSKNTCSQEDTGDSSQEETSKKKVAEDWEDAKVITLTGLRFTIIGVAVFFIWILLMLVPTLLYLADDYTIYIVGGFCILTILITSFLNINLHKVSPNCRTLIEFWGGKIRILLSPGLWLVPNISKVCTIKKKNFFMGMTALEPVAGLEEKEWDNNWQNRPPHPNAEQFVWEKVPGVEFDGGASGAAEFILPLKVTDLSKFLYKSNNPVSTIISAVKGIIRRACAKVTFNEALKECSNDKNEEKLQKDLLQAMRKMDEHLNAGGSKGEEELRENLIKAMRKIGEYSKDCDRKGGKELQEDLIKAIKKTIIAYDFGIKLVVPDDGIILKNFYPSPETKAGRDARFKAKQFGKVKVEEATGDSLSDEIRGEGWGKGIAAAAREGKISTQQVYAFETSKTVAEKLGDKAVIMNTSTGGLMEAAAGMAAVTNAMHAIPKKLSTSQDDTKDDGGDS